MLLIIGFLFMLLFIFAGVGIVSGMALRQIIDLPVALMVIVPLIFFLILSKNGSVIGRDIKTSFTKEHTYTGSELAGLSMAIRNTIKFILGSSGVYFLFGVIAMMMNLMDRQLLGPNMAVALFTLLYSVSISFFVFYPTQAWAENKLNALRGD
jgi:flagellar motor component MotA